MQTYVPPRCTRAPAASAADARSPASSAVIGSANVDERSFYLDYEANLPTWFASTQ